VWLLEHYVRANFDVWGDKFLEKAEEILAGFEEDIDSYGIGSISEIYDGDPPHAQRGAISQAWSVGAVLRINDMIEAYKSNGTAQKTDKASKEAKKETKKEVKKEAKKETKQSKK
jgi:glycogen debranching enzyme